MLYEGPVPGVDYPRTLPEFMQWFRDDDACLEYLARLRWPNGFVCPHCQHTKGYVTKHGVFSCGWCKRKTSVTAGTALAYSHKSLLTWFLVAWHVTYDKQGLSASSLQRLMGFGSYQTAWGWLHKLRRAMIRPGRDRLQGGVEVDETYVGGVEEGAIGRQTKTKSIVIVAVERRPRKAAGRIRLIRVPNMTKETLTEAVRGMVAEGSTIYTDGSDDYGGLEELLDKDGKPPYKWWQFTIKNSGRKAHDVLPRVHMVASLLKRWLDATHQGAVRPEYLDWYLDEYTFRYNRRSSRHRGLLFYRLLQQAMHVNHTGRFDMMGRFFPESSS